MTEHDEPALAPAPSFPTSIGVSTTETITVLGHDLAADLMGKVSFTELAYWLVMQRRPTPGQARVLEAVLVALADHGFTPTAITARLRAARQDRRAARPPGLGAPQSDRHGRVPDRRAQCGLLQRKFVSNPVVTS